MWGSGKERVAGRSSSSRRCSASHGAFWKVPPGAPQPSSFVAESERVTRRKFRPFRRCHRPAVTWATARGQSGWEELCRRALWGWAQAWVPGARGTFWSSFLHPVGQRVRKSRAVPGIVNKRFSTRPTPDSRSRRAGAACDGGEDLGTEPHAGAEFGTGAS